MGNLSRTYRPNRFAEVAGQTRVTDLLRKEVEQKKLGHAYLFSGPRGVGKTTIARIFSKAVNCLEPVKGEPCLKCEHCQRIAQQKAIDVIEMDAASHSGVENVRESIVEHVRFVPAGLSYKVYIIDEAHMLSTQAWNALLKTIEEPPPYAIFIFATTEKHKVPATIVSRCQRFEFMRISREDTVTRLQELAGSEGMKVDKDVLLSIAARTEGCLRDAENLLGQLFGLGEKHITTEIASLVMPASYLPLAAELLGLCGARDLKGVLERIETIEQEGVNLSPLFDDLLMATRKLLIATNVPREAQAMAQGDESDRALSSLIGKFSAVEMVNISLVLMERRRDVKQGLDARFAMELALGSIAAGMTSEAQTAGGGQPQGTQIAQPQVRASLPTKQTEPEKPATKPLAPNLPSNPPLSASIATSGITTAALKDAPQAKTDNQSAISLDDALVAWPKLLAALDEHKSLLFILKLSRPIEVGAGTIKLRFQYPYHSQTILKNQKNCQLIEIEFAKVLGVERIVLEGVVENDSKNEEGESKPQTTAGRLLEAFGGQVSS